MVRLLAVLLPLLPGPGRAQSVGQIIFNNRVTDTVIAPVFDADPANPGRAQRGNPPGGFPPGPQAYAGAPLAGTHFSAQLFGGPPHAAAAHLLPLPPAVPFRTGLAAGFVAAPAVTLAVPGVADGRIGKVQLRAWHNDNGRVTTWAQAGADGTIRQGESWPILTRPLGGPFIAPPNLVGLQSFNLSTGTTAGATVRINFQTNGSPVPPGHLPDYGDLFGARPSGLSHGWSADVRGGARTRHDPGSPDARHDSLIDLAPFPGAFWEMALPSGLYAVHVVAGDPAGFAAIDRWQVEDRPVISATPHAGARWTSGHGVVPVTDGRLTLRPADGAFRPRVCFLEITRLGPPTLRALLAGRGAGARRSLQFAGEPGFRHVVETSDDLRTWMDAGEAGPVGEDQFEFQETEVGSSPRFYRTRTLSSAAPALYRADNFQAEVGPGWSTRRVGNTLDGRRFLGPFGRESVTLTLTDLPEHTVVEVVCDLFIIGAWKGNNAGPSPDAWSLAVDGITRFRTTFRTASGGTQSYPDVAPRGAFPAQTGAVEIDVLGLNLAGDAVYRLTRSFVHQAGALIIGFTGEPGTGIEETSWGLDNVEVHLRDDPYER